MMADVMIRDKDAIVLMCQLPRILRAPYLLQHHKDEAEIATKMFGFKNKIIMISR